MCFFLFWFGITSAICEFVFIVLHPKLNWAALIGSPIISPELIQNDYIYNSMLIKCDKGAAICLASGRNICYYQRWFSNALQSWLFACIMQTEKHFAIDWTERQQFWLPSAKYHLFIKLQLDRNWIDDSERDSVQTKRQKRKREKKHRDSIKTN